MRSWIRLEKQRPSTITKVLGMAIADNVVMEKIPHCLG